MSLFSMNGMPASTSLSRFSTTSPSKYSYMVVSDEGESCFSNHFKGDEPSAW